MVNVPKEELLREFGRAIQEGNASLFVGAGISKQSGFTDWKELLTGIAMDLGLDIDQEMDLVALAQFHVNERQGRGTINQLLLNEFTRDITINENHRLIATIPVGTIWTTNYDTLIEDAYKEARRRPDVKSTSENIAVVQPNRDVVIYKMHGDVQQPEKAVLTKEDYEMYQDKRGLFSTVLQSELASRTFLFLGFSFNDPNIDYILARIRGLLKENQRPHYCVMKWPDPPSSGHPEDQANYEYKRRKLELRISDLKRYNIHAVMIDSFTEVTEVLRELARRARLGRVFISGSALDPAPFGKDRLDELSSALGQEVIRKGKVLVSGFGLGIGSAVALGGLRELYDRDLPMNQIAFFPFPQGVVGKNQSELYSQHRESILRFCGFSIVISGNREIDGAISPAPGVMEEFELAQELEVMTIPIGATGWAAKKIWDEISSDPPLFFGGVDVSSELEILGQYGRTNKEYIEAVFKIIDRVSRRPAWTPAVEDRIAMDILDS